MDFMKILKTKDWVDIRNDSKVLACKLDEPVLFENERAFENTFIDSHIKLKPSNMKDWIKLETENNPGIPDSILISDSGAEFYEFKVTHNGWIIFQKSQIPWYRQHNVDTFIVVWNDEDKRIYMFDKQIFIKIGKSRVRFSEVIKFVEGGQDEETTAEVLDNADSEF